MKYLSQVPANRMIGLAKKNFFFPKKKEKNGERWKKMTRSRQTGNSSSSALIMCADGVRRRSNRWSGAALEASNMKLGSNQRCCMRAAPIPPTYPPTRGESPLDRLYSHHGAPTTMPPPHHPIPAKAEAERHLGSFDSPHPAKPRISAGHISSQGPGKIRSGGRAEWCGSANGKGPLPKGRPANASLYAAAPFAANAHEI